MELSHKRARFELEKTVSDRARDLEVQIHTGSPHIFMLCVTALVTGTGLHAKLPSGVSLFAGADKWMLSVISYALLYCKYQPGKTFSQTLLWVPDTVTQ